MGVRLRHTRRALARKVLPKPSTRRRIGRRISRTTIGVVAIATFSGAVIVSQPLAVAAGSKGNGRGHGHVPSPPNYVQHKKIIGHPLRPGICVPGSPSVPAPSANTLAYLAESSNNEVQVVDEATGAYVGSPISVGTNPKGVAYWQPSVGSTRDPLVIVTNSGSHSVTIIDAVTQSVLATISIPSGSTGISVAASPTVPYAVVVDHGSGKVSIIDLTSYTDVGEISLTSTANALANIAFTSDGSQAYVTDPVEHKIYTLSWDGTEFLKTSTYTNAAMNPTGVATDLSNSSSFNLYVTDAQSSSGHLYSFAEGSSLSSPTTIESWASNTPQAVSVSPGESTAYVSKSGNNTISVVNISGHSFLANMTPNSSFSSIRAIGLSADGGTLLSADSATASVELNGSLSPYIATSLVSTDAAVWAIAPAPPVQDAWYAYVAGPTMGVWVVNSTTSSLVQQLNVTGAGAEAVSPDGKYVYVSDSSGIAVIQTSLVATSSNPVVATITGLQGAEPNAPNINQMAVSPSGDTLLATDSANGAVYVIDTNPADGTSYYRKAVGRIGLLGSGIGSTLVNPSGGLAYSPDGLYAYVTETGVSNHAYDGVTVLSLASATTTGYSYDATDEALTQDSTTMITPHGIDSLGIRFSPRL